MAAATARRILEWAVKRGLRIWWGRGAKVGSFFPMLDAHATDHWLVSVWTYGSVEVQFEMMKARKPFESQDRRLDLLRRLNAIEGINLPADRIDSRPSVKLTSLAPEGVLDEFLAVLDWIVGEVRAFSVSVD